MKDSAKQNSGTPETSPASPKFSIPTMSAACELFKLYYPEEYRVWEKSTCDGLTFDVDQFLDSPAFCTAEFKIGEERILVVEPL